MADSRIQSKGSFSSSSSFRSRKYDVFLSFRGEDTRKNFTDHLFAALVRHRFSTYRDDEKLDRGEEIGAELLKAIEGSRIAIIVFSSNYATSRWCLDELVKIMECKNTLHQRVVPVFYDVDPSDVRAQKGTFAQALDLHEKRYKGDAGMEGKMKRWKAALTEAANLSGWDSRNVANGHESKLIEKIVEDISIKLNIADSNVATYPVDIESRVQELKVLLSMESNDVRMVGIWGIGGLGKTTIAKAIYNHVYPQFEGSCFLANVRETSKQSNGLIGLQEQLLLDVLKKKGNWSIRNVDQGIAVIQRELKGQRIFLVLDDVDDIDQLKAFGIRRDWFRSKSRIIVTTRDQSLLKFLAVDAVYEPQLLKPCDALQLFSWHAFGKDYPIDDYVELSKNVVDYAGRLPLALEVLGCFLCDKSMLEWKNALEKLKLVPHDKIQDKLEISYDSLSGDEKEIFLDIACFFFGADQNYAKKILEGCGFFPEIGFGVLSRRCLIKINELNQVTMHDMLRDMGREIVRRECPKEPGKRTRLWFHDDVLDVLTNHTSISLLCIAKSAKGIHDYFSSPKHAMQGTEAVEGLILNLPASNCIRVTSQAFAKMNKLRLLILNHVHVTGSYEHFSKRLAWLCWHGFPLKSIPSDLYLEKLVAIDMSYSNLKRVWKGTKSLNKLKFLNLSHSLSLAETPDFSGLDSLEILLLNSCTSLVSIHQCIEYLIKLVTLDLNDCFNLRRLPLAIFKLKSLQILNLIGCFKVEKLVVSPSKSWFSALWNRELPPVSLPPSAVHGLLSTRILNLEYCTLTYVPFSISNSESPRLRRLTQALPSKYSKFMRPEFLTNLEGVSTVDRCTALEGISVGSDRSILLTFSGCNKSNGNNLDSDLRVRRLCYEKLGANSNFTIFLPGIEVPNWFTYKSLGSILSFVVPPHRERKILAWILCIVYACFIDVNDCFGVITGYQVTNKLTMASVKVRPHLGMYRMTRHRVLLHYFPYGSAEKNDHANMMVAGDEVEFSVFADAALGKVKECGVNLIYEGDETDYKSNGNEEQSTFTRKVDDGDINEFFGYATNLVEEFFEDVQRGMERLKIPDTYFF